MNIGNRVRQLRQAKNMKIADLAEAIGVDAANISRLETGKQKQFTEQALSNIARSLGVDIADLFTSDVKSNTVCKNSISEDVAQVKDVFRIEMLDVSASAGNGLIQGGDVIDVIHAIEYRTDNAVRGDSMCPTIEPGDLIFVDVSINQFDGDGIYVFGFDDKIYVKRLQMIPDKLLVISDNQIYREWGITSENEHRFMVFGKVLISQSQTLKRHN